MFHRLADSSPKFLRTVFWYEMPCFCRVLLESSVLLGTNLSLVTNSYCELVVSNIQSRDRRERLTFVPIAVETFISNFSALDYRRPHKPHNFIGLT